MQEPLHPLQLVEQLPEHMDAQLLQPVDVEEPEQFDEQSEQPPPEPVEESLHESLHEFEHPLLHADEPHPLFDEPMQDWLQEVPQPDLAVPVQLLLQSVGSSLVLHDDKIPGVIIANPNIGKSFFMNLLREILSFIWP